MATLALGGAIGLGALSWTLLRPPVPTPLPPSPAWKQGAGRAADGGGSRQPASATSKVAAPIVRAAADAAVAIAGRTAREATSGASSAPGAREGATRTATNGALTPRSGAVARTRTGAARAAGAHAKLSTPELATGPHADEGRARRLVAEAKALLGEGKLAEAQRRFGEAVGANPSDAAAVAGLASVAFEQANYARTVELARRAVALDRRHLAARMLLGDANFKLLRYEDALRAWREVLRLDPDHPAAKKRIERVKRQLGTPAASGG